MNLRDPTIRRGCHRLWIAILCVAWIVCVLLVNPHTFLPYNLPDDHFLRVR